MTEEERTEQQKEPEWITHACFFACGGRCVNQSLVKKGRVLEQRSDVLHDDSPDYPQQRGCARGRSLRQMIFSADRLKYPMKRAHWEPGGGDRNLRGRDEWVRISWDEALDIVASETARIKTLYGNKAILATGYEYRNVYPGLYYGAALNAYGGCVTTWGQASKGGFPVVTACMKGKEFQGAAGLNDRKQLNNAKLILLWGINSAWSQAGNTTYFYKKAKEHGARIIVLDSWYSPTAQALADLWIPVRPGTDTALLLAIAYVLIQNKLYDAEFLNRYCVGFDAAHMPKGNVSSENFHDYVLGKYDKVPKTPEWASEICGTPSEMIVSLAKEMGTVKPMTMRCSFAPARTAEGGRFAQAFYTVGWMTGNVGLPGAEVSVAAIAGNVVNGGSAIVKPGKKGFQLPDNPICAHPRGGGKLGNGQIEKGKYYGIAMGEIWDAVLEKKHRHFSDGEVPIDIKMIWKIGDGGRMNQSSDFNKAEKAYRSVEFAVASDLWMTSDCKYSDVVLPATSLWERFGCIMPQTNRELLIWSSQVSEPLFECRDDLWMEAELCKRWGLDPKLVQPKASREVAFSELSGSVVVQPNGEERKLLTFTESDIQDFHIEAKPQAGLIPWQEFKKTGVYQIPRKDDCYDYICLEKFRNDPIKHPVGTKSGKLEIYCKELSRCYEQFGLSKIDSIPKYVPSANGYETSVSDPLKKCFQLISVHHIRRAHQAFDQIHSLRALFPCELMMNDSDAAGLGIRHGDTVRVFNKNGSVIRQVGISALIMPGVVIIGEGGWTKHNSSHEDEAGNANSLSAMILCGEGQQPWNTTLVMIEKSKEQVPGDYKTIL